jgi:hypothetical protein
MRHILKMEESWLQYARLITYAILKKSAGCGAQKGMPADAIRGTRKKRHN